MEKNDYWREGGRWAIRGALLVRLEAKLMLLLYM